MDQRLAAGDGDDRRAALVDSIKAFLDAQAPVQNRPRIVDLAAAGTGQVAAKQRLEHQHQGEARAAHQSLSDDIGAYGNLLFQRYGHYQFLIWVVGNWPPRGYR